jgi:hypothetical protein
MKKELTSLFENANTDKKTLKFLQAVTKIQQMAFEKIKKMSFLFFLYIHEVIKKQR